MSKVTAARLRELMEYDRVTGVFSWLQDCDGFHQAGDPVGHANDGYLLTDIDGHSYKLHRLAWFYVHGDWPAGQIDHINGVRWDNRIENLRSVSLAVNNQNLRRARITNHAGYLGVSRAAQKWQARITVDRKQRHLGVFDTPELAHAAYVRAKRKLHEGNTL